MTPAPRPTLRAPAVPLLALTLLVTTPAGPAQAQETALRYTTTSSVEFGGTLGAVMEMVTGDATTTSETVYLSSGRMRADTEEASSILDLPAGRMIQVDHRSRSYSVLDLASLREAMEGAGADLDEAMEEARLDMEARDEMAPVGDRSELEISVDTEPTGERRTLSGLDAEKVYVTVRIEGTATSEANEEVQGGSLVFLSELWQARDVPALEALQASQGEAAEAFAPELTRGLGQALERATASDPRIRVALEEGAERAEDLGGLTVRSTTFVVTVPRGEEFDREAALELREVSLTEEARGAAADAAKEAAEDAMGRLGGLFGGGDDEDEDPEREATQTTLMKLVTEITDWAETEASDDLFAPPPDYEERSGPGGPGA